MVAIDPGIRIRTTRSLPWTRTETACRYDAPDTASVTCAAGSNPSGTENCPSWTTAEATRPHLHIAWGVGGSFEQSVLSIPLLDPSPRHVRYFGDLDRAGLRIAASAARRAVQAGLPLAVPAIGCYQFLLDGPRRWRRPDDSNRVGQSDYGDACAWLPSALRPRAGELLASGEKIAQEHLGLQALLCDPTLLGGLAS